MWVLTAAGKGKKREIKMKRKLDQNRNF